MYKPLKRFAAYFDLLAEVCGTANKQNEMLREATNRIDVLAEENIRLRKEVEELRHECETLGVYADMVVGAGEVDV